MLEFAVALKLLAQQRLQYHADRAQKSAEMRVIRTPAQAKETAMGGVLSRRERHELRKACERFVAEQPSRLNDLREIR